ncbi:transposase, partial [Pusillimonas sp. MFBS29]|uniref:transposase n=1 Tax=Pusillimonas sp. MFBS29 TaxID=2886690 RepID=UPI001D1164C5
MSAQPKRFTEEFKIEAVRQVTERGHRVADVAERLGVSAHSLYQWRKRYGQADCTAVRREADQAGEVRRLKAELRRVTEERDILKKAAVGSMGHCNTFLLILNDGGFTNGTNGTAWAYTRRQGGGLA